jgi:alpha-amylase
MKCVNFLFAIHNHQPVGNFDFVFEDAYSKSYLPFLQVLERFPSVKIAIHFSGILLNWINDNHPQLIAMIKKLTDRGQLEIMTGGFYEPILNTIPEPDRIGQISKLTKMVKKLFNYNPQGMWTAERVWEPTLPSTLTNAGIKYTVIDDTHFKYAGLTESQLRGYYITEDLGNSTFLFPISKRLRYSIPFEECNVTIDYLHSMASDDGQNIIVFADDGEKFGSWPNTYNHVYNEKWLERFFADLEDNKSWIKMSHFSDTIKMIKPLGKIYLPTASYSEMMQWALFPERVQAYEDFENYLKDQDSYEKYHVFVRGGFWRNFLAKYPESSDMYKKMLRVSRTLCTLPTEIQAKAGRAFDSLWAGQCNCPYWHGVFGGLYLPHLRDAIYENLIKAESLAEKLTDDTFPSIETVNYGIDGCSEVIIKTRFFNSYLNLDQGAMMYELDFKPVNKNLSDTLTRRKEAYHKKLENATVAQTNSEKSASIHDLIQAKEPDLESKLFYDFYPRKSFIDHFLDQDTTLETFATAQYREDGDFFDQVYKLQSKKIDKDSARVKLQRIGNVCYRGKYKQIKLLKSFEFQNKDGVIITDYTLKNETGKSLNVWFGVELNFGLQAGQAEDRYYYINDGKIGNKYLNSQAEIKNTHFIGLRDEWRKVDIQISMDRKGTIWRFPIETISLSEGGFERVYQSSAVLPNWKIKLQKKWQVKIVLRLQKWPKNVFQF